ncbi:MAG: flagellar hook assembly protein FlgD [Burkholderiales bacterium]
MAITVADAQLLARPDSAAKPHSKAPGANDMGNRFLTLLVTQMRNQDPLNPLQNSEVTSQLAQISTVTGVDKLNTTLENMSKAFASAQTMQASSLVGRGVLAPGKVLQLSAGGALGGFELAGSAAAVKVDILNAGGHLVKTLDLQGQPAGVSNFVWDGLDANQAKLPEGLYSFAVRAANGTTKVDANLLAFSPVRSVTLGGSQLMLNTQTLGSVAYDQVKQVF